MCPILSLHCVGVSGTGTIKITPLRSAELIIGATSGSGARLRVTAGATGAITAVEIAAGGTGYPSGPVTVTILDPYGYDAIIAATASGGAVSSASVVQAGSNYSGYISMDIGDFIEGVTYDFIPRYIEQTSGSGTLTLLGYRLSYRPFQVF